MTFTIMDLFIIFGYAISVLTFCFGVVKFFNAATHKRIDEVKSDITEEIKDIRENYAHKDSINQAVLQIRDIMNDVKAAQNRMETRIDEFWKWAMTKEGPKQ